MRCYEKKNLSLKSCKCYTVRLYFRNSTNSIISIVLFDRFIHFRNDFYFWLPTGDVCIYGAAPSITEKLQKFIRKRLKRYSKWFLDDMTSGDIWNESSSSFLAFFLEKTCSSWTPAGLCSISCAQTQIFPVYDLIRFPHHRGDGKPTGCTNKGKKNTQ